MAALHLTQENFEEEVLKSDVPVLVDFWAEWCGPCKMLSPVIDEIAEDAADFKVCKVNIDDHMALAKKYFVMSISLPLTQILNELNGFVGVDGYVNPGTMVPQVMVETLLLYS